MLLTQIRSYSLFALVMAGLPFQAGAQSRSIQGEWRDESPELTNSVVVYTQNGSQISARGSFVINGFRCEWVGSGSISGNKVTHTVQYTRRPPDEAWRGADGRLVLTLSEDGKVLSGTWSNKNGHSGPKRLTRRSGGSHAESGGSHAASGGAQSRSIQGEWRDESPELSNSVVVYTQNGSQISARGSFVINGFRCEWVGSGSISGNKVTHTVQYTRRPPDEAWRGADGRLVLTLSEDGTVLSGTWSNKNGHSGPKRLTRWVR